VPNAVTRWLWARAEAAVINPVALPDINRARRELGLLPVASLLRLWKSVPDLSVALFPAWFAAPQPDWPRPFVTGDFALFDADPATAFTPELQAFLEQGDAPLVFTHGTGNRQAGEYFAHAIAAAGRLGRRAILLTSERAQLPAALPADVLWQAYVPLRLLLPHARALIHHGGIGTTAEALRAGVPQLIVALAFDQFDNGARVARLGAGVSMNAAFISTAALQRKLESVLRLPRHAPVTSHHSDPDAWTCVIDAIDASPVTSN
jgi:rhamnosyltransferase subunit B